MKIEGQIPERRPDPEELEKIRAEQVGEQSRRTGERRRGIPVWRCKVCGYLCARDGPPAVCPICKADRDRFEPFPL